MNRDMDLIRYGNDLFHYLPDNIQPGTADPFERLQQRLDEFQYVVRPVVGDDGNCVPRSIAHQLFSNEEHHPYVRETVAAQLRVFWERYIYQRSAGAYERYVDKMATQTKWCDFTFCQAAADVFRVKFFEIVSYDSYAKCIILPHDRVFKKVIFICSSDEHTDSMFPVGVQQERVPPVSDVRLRLMRNTGLFTAQDLNRNLHTHFA
ncbi:OTU domain-containing protein [Artemisia annua]|uniref:OTU domain-containing protein n=1 Tax=Artemisia annua TaxID=35608 RepID=A0A2U1N439_ARTAN|nr:OTU domain-containing protein [Artemisia annua]